MSYSQLTLSQVVEDFEVTVQEGDRLLPDFMPVSPSSMLQATLKETLPWAIAIRSEKARSAGIINPVLLELKRQLHGTVSIFSGEEFNVQGDVNLTGDVDF